MNLSVGLRCMAPMKNSAKATKRLYRDVEVLWVSSDGLVAEVTPVNGKAARLSFGASVLRPAGTESPELGVVS